MQKSSLNRLKKAIRTIIFLKRVQQSSKDLAERAKLALLKPFTSRTDEDQNLIEVLMSRYKYFISLKQKYGGQLFKSFCQYLYFRREDEQKTVIEAGEVGQTFYIILSGEVGIFVKKTQPNQDNKKKGLKTMKTLNIEPDQSDELIEVNRLSAGQSFGEASLLDSRSRTSATVITSKSTDFACIDRSQFWDVLGKHQSKEFFDKIQFLRGISFLSSWYEQDLKSLSYHFQQERFIKDETIYSKGDPCSKIYFIKEGQISLSGSLKIRDRVDSTDLLLQKSRDQKWLQICILTEGAIFGDEQYVGHDQRQFTAKCLSKQAEIYSILKTDLDKRLWWKEAQNAVLSLVNRNQEWITERMSLLTNLQRQINQRYENDLSAYNSIKSQNSIKKQFISRSNTFHLEIKQNSQESHAQKHHGNQISVRKTDNNSKFSVDFLMPDLSQIPQLPSETSRQLKSVSNSGVNKTTLIKKNENNYSIFERAKLLGIGSQPRSFRERKLKNQQLQSQFLQELYRDNALMARQRRQNEQKQYFPYDEDLRIQDSIIEKIRNDGRTLNDSSPQDRAPFSIMQSKSGSPKHFVRQRMLRGNEFLVRRQSTMEKSNSIHSRFTASTKPNTGSSNQRIKVPKNMNPYNILTSRVYTQSQSPVGLNQLLKSSRISHIGLKINRF